MAYTKNTTTPFVKLVSSRGIFLMFRDWGCIRQRGCLFVEDSSLLWIAHIKF
jgi:hypothetical protein